MTGEQSEILKKGVADKMKSMDIFGSSRSNDEIKDSDLTYDTKFKRLFTKKRFLTPILKNIIPEYKYCSLEEIETLINPRGDEQVNPAAYSSEDSGKGNETVTRYDVLIDCALPGKKKKACVNLFFDLEMQRESEPGYPIPKRGVYYCCRLISRQIETLGKESYKQIKPVYSVWILINDIPEELQNSVFTARMSGGFDNCAIDATDLNKQIDLVHLCLIYLSKDFGVKAGQSNLIKYLQSVFIRKVDDPSCNPYCEYSSEIKKEVDEMMSVRESFELRGERRGEQRGEQRGVIKLLRRIDRTDEEIIQYLMTELNTPLTREQAIEALRSYYEKNS